MSRYRIVVNGNGKFSVQSRFFGFKWAGWLSRKKEWGMAFPTEHGTLYDTSEQAIQGLLEAQAHDQRKANDRKWTTVIEESR